MIWKVLVRIFLVDKNLGNKKQKQISLKKKIIILNKLN